MIEDLTGKRFGRLTAIELAEPKMKRGGQKATMWRCKCDCGNEKVVPASNLKRGKTRSCGCLREENVKICNLKHGGNAGGKRERLYDIWRGMKERCTLPSVSTYKNYGAKGIKVCEEWGEYTKFKEWALANGYADDLTIDRIDSSKDYCPENCRWATAKEQGNNTARNNRITAKGKTQTLAQWAEETGISATTIAARIKKLQWSPDEAVTIPVRRRSKWPDIQ